MVGTYRRAILERKDKKKSTKAGEDVEMVDVRMNVPPECSTSLIATRSNLIGFPCALLFLAFLRPPAKSCMYVYSYAHVYATWASGRPVTLGTTGILAENWGYRDRSQSRAFVLYTKMGIAFDGMI